MKRSLTWGDFFLMNKHNKLFFSFQIYQRFVCVSVFVCVTNLRSNSNLSLQYQDITRPIISGKVGSTNLCSLTTFIHLPRDCQIIQYQELWGWFCWICSFWKTFRLRLFSFNLFIYFLRLIYMKKKVSYLFDQSVSLVLPRIAGLGHRLFYPCQRYRLL